MLSTISRLALNSILHTDSRRNTSQSTSLVPTTLDLSLSSNRLFERIKLSAREWVIKIEEEESLLSELK